MSLATKIQSLSRKSWSSKIELRVKVALDVPEDSHSLLVRRERDVLAATAEAVEAEVVAVAAVDSLDREVAEVVTEVARDTVATESKEKDHMAARDSSKHTEVMKAVVHADRSTTLRAEKVLCRMIEEENPGNKILLIMSTTREKEDPRDLLMMLTPNPDLLAEEVTTTMKVTNPEEVAAVATVVLVVPLKDHYLDQTHELAKIEKVVLLKDNQEAVSEGATKADIPKEPAKRIIEAVAEVTTLKA